MSIRNMRVAIASVGLAAAGIAGVYLTAADDVEQTRELPLGEVYTVLYGGAGGLPANVCDGIPFEDCTTATGLERALCELRGSGLSYDDERNQYVDGYYRDIVLIHDASGRCIAKLRALRAQTMMMRVAIREGVLSAPMLAAVNALRADPGFGRRYKDLPAQVRARLATQRWAGHDHEDDRTVDDEGTVLDGGLP